MIEWDIRSRTNKIRLRLPVLRNPTPTKNLRLLTTPAPQPWFLLRCKLRGTKVETNLTTAHDKLQYVMCLANHALRSWERPNKSTNYYFDKMFVRAHHQCTLYSWRFAHILIIRYYAFHWTITRGLWNSWYEQHLETVEVFQCKQLGTFGTMFLATFTSDQVLPDFSTNCWLKLFHCTVFIFTAVKVMLNRRNIEIANKGG